MPPAGVKKGTKRARQYEHIKDSQKSQGASESRAEEEMRFRRVFHYPPFTRMVHVMVRDGKRERGWARIVEIAERLAVLVERLLGGERSIQLLQQDVADAGNRRQWREVPRVVSPAAQHAEGQQQPAQRQGLASRHRRHPQTLRCRVRKR